MRKLKRFVLVIAVILIAIVAYTELVNLNTTTMTFRQKLLKAFYPVVMWFSKNDNSSVAQKNVNAKPAVSFYSLSTILNNGKRLDFESLKGKKVLLVNTASDCGYTNQYEDLQKLSERYKDKLLVIGFPANDFKEQEKGSDEEIAQFCKINYGVTFALAKKSTVRKSDQQNEVFRWLSDKNKNGWLDRAPQWNFSKYLVNEHGLLTHYFEPAVEPLAKELVEAIQS